MGSSEFMTPTRVRLTSIDLDGKQHGVFLHVVYDGLEHLGRLWFRQDASTAEGVADRTLIPGRTRDEVIAFAERLRPEELAMRYTRALTDKRRYRDLRKTTDDVLLKIRYLNQLALAMRGGLIDMEGAAQEIDLTEAQLHELVRALRESAGVES